MKRLQLLIVSVLLTAVVMPVSSKTSQTTQNQRTQPVGTRAVIWQHPGDISSRDLFYGPGSKALAPKPPFRFIEEDKSGTTPKFKVKDASNVEWSVKLGRESQSETVAVRLVWAAGYFTEEAYYYPRMRFGDLPRLSRGDEYIEGGRVAREVRFEPRRASVKRGDLWDWRNNPFVGSRELDGLRVLMILLNNWDVKGSNNKVLMVTSGRTGRQEARYAVTDLGATLGRAGGFGEKRSKNDVEDFISSEFAPEVEGRSVDFDFDLAPTKLGWVAIAYPPAFRRQWKKNKAMEDIPLTHVQWIGRHLARLTSAQLHDAFRAASYDRATASTYVQALRGRIRTLNQLSGPGRQLAGVNPPSD